MEQPQKIKKDSANLTALLTNKLLDENLMQRYGTSLNINMGREYQKYLDQKYLDLKEEFDRINKNSDEIITIDELSEFINSYSTETGRTYDKAYVTKLFNLIDVDRNKEITIQEFIMSYIILEEKLRLKKIKLQKLDDDLRITKEKYLKGVNENKAERITQEGIGEMASLNISLLEASNLKPMDYNGASDPYVIFTLDGKQLTSSYKPATLDPVWNEDFLFQVKKKGLTLKVDVWDKDVGSDDYEGGIEIPLKDLEHQQKEDIWYNLELNGEKEGNGKIRLRLQYVWSRYKYFQDNYNKTELQILRLKEDISELNRYFDLFEKPFGIILYGEIDGIIEKRILERSEDIGQYMASSRRSVYASPRFSLIKGGIAKGIASKMENVLTKTLSNML